MAGSTFNPIRDLDRFFSEVTRTPDSIGLPMDLFRNGGTFIARIDMPGVDPSSIDVDVEDRTLTVRAERSATDPEVEVTWLTRERPTGIFARQLTLGNRVAVDRNAADSDDGVLTLTIPVADDAKPRKISVTHTDGGRSSTVIAADEAAPDDPVPSSGSVSDERPGSAPEH